MLKGVVFDLDGVLIDTEYFQWQGWVEALKSFDVSMSKDDYHHYAGIRGDIIESKLIEKYNLDVEKGLLLAKKEKLLMEWFKSKPPALMPYAKESVQFFIDRNFRVAVASTAPEDEVLLKLKGTSLYSLFQIIVSGTDVKRGKPYPDVYLATVEKLGLRPEECISFEDTQYGVESAKSAGLKCLAVPNEYTKKQDFSKADGIFGNLKEVLEFVVKIPGS